MTIEEAKILQDQLNESINDLIIAFQKETKLNVCSVSVFRSDCVSAEDQIIMITTDVKL